MARAQCDGALLDDEDSSKGAGVGAATSVVVHALGWHFTQANRAIPKVRRSSQLKAWPAGAIKTPFAKMVRSVDPLRLR